MFFVSLTKDGVVQNFQSVKVEEFELHSWKVTIITDKFLSDFISESDGFSIVESPLINTSDFQNIIFSKITYDSKNDNFSIFKSTISGRPIYYHINSNGEFFCSTHISLLRIAGVRIEENKEVLPEFFVYRCVVPPQTLFKNINQVIAGSKLILKFLNGKYQILCTKTYNPPLPKDTNNDVNLDIVTSHVLTYLDEAIKSLALCSNRLAITFSGGLDSSILYKICHNNYGIKTTYSTGFPFEDSETNIEKKYAVSAADAFQTENNFYECTTDQYLRGFIEGISGAEQPLHHLQSVLLYMLFKESIPKTKNIIISGLGADGSFGSDAHFSVLKRKKNNQSIRNLYKNFSRKSDTDNILWSIGAFGYDKWVKKSFNVSKQDIIKGRKNLIKTYENRSIYDQISLLDFYRTSVTQSIWSKIGESTGKILYYPFDNLELLNYVFSISWENKLKTPKHILRNVARQLQIPEMIITRPKSSFGIHSKIWVEKGGTFEQLIPLASKIINEKEIRKVQSPKSKKSMLFWNMLNYSIWKRLFINNEAIDILLEEL